MHNAPTAARSVERDVTVTSVQLRRIARLHGAVFGFYAIDGLLLTLFGALGSVPAGFGAAYVGIGWCAASFAVWRFRRGARRQRDLESNNVAMTLSAGALMLASAWLAPQIGALMLMSMMTVLAATALQLRMRPLLATWLALAVGTAATMLASAQPFQLPMDTPARRLASAVWFAWLLGKCTLVNVEGTRLRQQVTVANSKLMQALHELRKVASTDELTVIGNRRSIVSDLDAALRAASNGPRAVAVVLFDVDHFKTVNDRFGHAIGDAVLREVASILSRGLRPDDRIGRYGGEEFLLVLPQLRDAAAARDTAERVRAAIEAFDWDAVAAGLTVTASAGVALVGRGESATDAIARADSALYAAKAEGRNRVALG